MGFNADLVKGTLAPIMLKILSEREMYGYEIVQVVHKRTDGKFQWKEGSLYPCLHKLEADRLLKSVWREGPNGKQRKYYRLTRRGCAQLAKRTEEWADFAQTVNALLMGAPA